MLKVENISSGYGKKQVLYNLSLEVKKGEILQLNGGNGSGKSTFLKCLFNLIPIWKGEIYFKGISIKGIKPHNLIYKGIVYIPQKEFYFEDLTVEENLRTAGSIYPRKELDIRISRVFEYIRFSSLKKRKPFNLSGGERKLLAIGMGLIHNPRLILFDEPFAGVDTQRSLEIYNMLSQFFYKNGITAIIVEHKETFKQLYTRKIKLELGIIKN